MDGSTVNAVNSDKEWLTFSDRFGYLCVGLCYTFCMIIPAFLIYYATERLALAIGAVSAMMAMVKVFDGFTDIIAGIIIDNTHSKYGKSKPWILRASIPYAICMILLFSVPTSMGQTAKLIMLAVFYALTVSVFGTLIGVARYALVPAMTDNQKERGQLGVLGDGIGAFACGLGMAVTLVIVGKIGWTATFVISGIIAAVAGILCYICTHDRTEEINGALEAEKKAKPSAKQILSAIFMNKYALMLFVIVFLQQFGAGAITSGGTYYFTYVVGDVSWYSKMMGVTTVLSLVAMFLCTYLISKMGAKNMFVLGGAGTVVCFLIVALTPSPSIRLLMVTLPLAMMFGQSFLTATFAAFSANAVDFGTLKNGVRLEGVTSSVLNIGIKIGSAIATAAVGAIMAAGGFKEGGVAQTAGAIHSISVAYIGLPLVAYIAVTLIVLFAYRLEKDKKKILDARASVN